MGESAAYFALYILSVCSDRSDASMHRYLEYPLLRVLQAQPVLLERVQQARLPRLSKWGWLRVQGSQAICNQKIFKPQLLIYMVVFYLLLAPKIQCCMKASG